MFLHQQARCGSNGRACARIFLAASVVLRSPFRVRIREPALTPLRMSRNSARGAVVRKFLENSDLSRDQVVGIKGCVQDIPNLCVCLAVGGSLVHPNRSEGAATGCWWKLSAATNAKRYRSVVAPVKTLVPELPVFGGEPSPNTVAPFQPVEVINVCHSFCRIHSAAPRTPEGHQATKMATSKKLIGRSNNLHCLK